jgi:hypothetical protein
VPQYDRPEEGGPTCPESAAPRSPGYPARDQGGLKVTLAGNAKSRLSEKILALRSVDVTNRRRDAIGKIENITNDNGALSVRSDEMKNGSGCLIEGVSSVWIRLPD